jgi:serine/threonine protein kinase
MSETRQCTECGSPLPVDAPGGHCLRCILQFGLTPQEDAPSDDTDVPSTIPAETPGVAIGRYRLLEPIGEGGYGVVYRAEQHQPVRREVALKLLKLGMDTKAVIARFEAERQALALMDHPHIAKIFDAGATATGRPYFVMELVRGQRISDYCDARRLAVPERLEVFIQVCHAVQHAHQKGIIHRDIKPSNILVVESQGKPVPSVIDFGIAKATDQRLTDKTLYTAFEQFVGTPAYMSPEQAAGVDIDTRTDIYSLGVLLYELLSGCTPFRTATIPNASLDELRRAIREKEPLRPSACLETLRPAELAAVAQKRQSDPVKLCRILRGDLDWIVVKALEKEPQRRYQTVSGLAMDLQRYLDNEPVLARPPSRVYRLQKLVRRNKLAFAAATAVTLALAGGLSLTLWSLLQEKQARKRATAAEALQNQLRQQAQAGEGKARTEAAKSAQVASLLEEMLKGVGPSVAIGRDTTLLREILDRTAARVPQGLTNQPEVAMELCMVLAETYDELGLDKQAEGMTREALRLARAVYGERHRAVAKALRRLGYTLANQGKLGEAEPLVRQALAMGRKLFGNDSLEVAESLNTLANILWDRGSLPEAEALNREALDIRRRIVANDPLVGESLNDLAGVLTAEGKLDEAGDLYREALAVARRAFGDDHPSVPVAINNLATVLKKQNKLAEAEPLFREALDLQRKLLGREHPNLAVAMKNLAMLLRAQGKLAEAEVLQRQALAMEQKLLGAENPSIAISLRNLGEILQDQGNLSEAESNLRHALEMQEKIYGTTHPEVAATREKLGRVLAAEAAKQAARQKSL